MKGVVNLISTCGLVNLSFAEVRGILEKQPNKAGFVGTCEIPEGESIREHIQQALHNPLFLPDLEHVDAALVAIEGPSDLNLRVVNEIVNEVMKSIDPSANIKFGAAIDPSLGRRLQVTIIGSGPQGPLLSAAEGINTSTQGGNVKDERREW